MLVSDGYERLFKEIGVEDEPSKKIILEYIFNLARIGIECVNNHYKTLTENEKGDKKRQRMCCMDEGEHEVSGGERW